MIQDLPKETTTPAFSRPYPFHTKPNLSSHHSFYSAQSSKSHFSCYSRSPISQEPLLAHLKSIILKKIQPFISPCPFSPSYSPPTVHPPDSFPLPSREKEQGEFGRQIETPQSLPSTQTHSCIPPSLSSNQTGPTSYLPCHTTSSISIYISQTNESTDTTPSQLTHSTPGHHSVPGHPHSLTTSLASSFSNQELLRSSPLESNVIQLIHHMKRQHTRTSCIREPSIGEP